MFCKWPLNDAKNIGAWAKSIKMQDKPVDFNVKDYQKLTDTVWHSSLHLIFKILPLVEF